MITAPITADQLRRDVAAVLAVHGMTINEFVAADIDDFEADELRDLWLMTRDVLAFPSKSAIGLFRPGSLRVGVDRD